MIFSLYFRDYAFLEKDGRGEDKLCKSDFANNQLTIDHTWYKIVV